MLGDDISVVSSLAGVTVDDVTASTNVEVVGLHQAQFAIVVRHAVFFLQKHSTGRGLYRVRIANRDFYDGISKITKKFQDSLTGS